MRTFITQITWRNSNFNQRTATAPKTPKHMYLSFVNQEKGKENQERT